MARDDHSIAGGRVKNSAALDKLMGDQKLNPGDVALAINKILLRWPSGRRTQTRKKHWTGPEAAPVTNDLVSAWRMAPPNGTWPKRPRCDALVWYLVNQVQDAERLLDYGFDPSLFAEMNLRRIAAFEMDREASNKLVDILYPRQTASSPKLNLGNIQPPTNIARLVPRVKYVAQLDRCWQSDTTNIVQIMAPSGCGKTTVVWSWLHHGEQSLERRGYPEVKQAIDWPFQNPQEKFAGSSDFAQDAARHLGVTIPTETAEQLGRHLAREFLKVGGLIILDGVEALQDPSTHESGGTVNDEMLRGLLKTVRTAGPRTPDQPRRLLLLTTQWAIPDLVGDGVAWIELDPISVEEGIDLLERYQHEKHMLRRDLEAFKNIVRAFNRHPLTLVLVASQLVAFHEGDPNQFHELDLLDSPDAKAVDQALRAMRNIDLQFENPKVKSEVMRGCHQVLCLLGLFNESVSMSLIDSLRDEKLSPIDGLTDGLDDNLFLRSVGFLKKLNLLYESPDKGVLEALPLVRRHYAEKVQEERFNAARTTAHRRLYEIRCLNVPPLPNSMDEMAPLFEAVKHGAQAGWGHDALHNTYLKRIMRDPDRYAFRNFQAITKLLEALSYYFRSKSGRVFWGETIDGLSKEDQLRVFTEAGSLLLPQKGWADSRVGQIYKAAKPLALEVAKETPGDITNRQVVDVGIGLWSYRLVHGPLVKAKIEAKWLLDLSEETSDVNAKNVACRAWGTTAFWLGEFQEAERYLRKCLEEYRDVEYRPYLADLTADPTSVAGVDLALTLWALGRNEDAIEVAEASKAQARLKPIAYCYTVALSGWLRFKLRENDACLSHANELLRLAEEYGGLAGFRALGNMMQGLLLTCRKDNSTEGLRVMDEGIREWQNGGANLTISDFNMHAAEALLQGGNLEEAGERLEQAIELAMRTGERCSWAEIHRLKGEIKRLSSKHFVGADLDLREALQTAEKQGSLIFQLRTAMSLLVLAIERTDLGIDEQKIQIIIYKNVLHSICESFVQGHDSADLQDALQLLADSERYPAEG